MKKASAKSPVMSKGFWEWTASLPKGIFGTGWGVFSLEKLKGRLGDWDVRKKKKTQSFFQKRSAVFVDEGFVYNS